MEKNIPSFHFDDKITNEFAQEQANLGEFFPPAQLETITAEAVDLPYTGGKKPKIPKADPITRVRKSKAKKRINEELQKQAEQGYYFDHGITQDLDITAFRKAISESVSVTGLLTDTEQQIARAAMRPSATIRRIANRFNLSFNQTLAHLSNIQTKLATNQARTRTRIEQLALAPRVSLAKINAVCNKRRTRFSKLDPTERILAKEIRANGINIWRLAKLLKTNISDLFETLNNLQKKLVRTASDDQTNLSLDEIVIGTLELTGLNLQEIILLTDGRLEVVTNLAIAAQNKIESLKDQGIYITQTPALSAKELSFAKLHLAGIPKKEIAKEQGKSPQYVHSMLYVCQKKLAIISPKIASKFKNPHKKTKRKPSRVDRIKKYYSVYPGLTDELSSIQKDILAELLRDQSPKEIAQTLGITLNAVYDNFKIIEAQFGTIKAALTDLEQQVYDLISVQKLTRQQAASTLGKKLEAINAVYRKARIKKGEFTPREVRAKQPITQLSPRESQAHELQISGLSYQEIADRLSTTRSAVTGLLNRAHAKLKLPANKD